MSLHFIEIQWNDLLRAKGVVILGMGHHLTSHPTDIERFSKIRRSHRPPKVTYRQNRKVLFHMKNKTKIIVWDHKYTIWLIWNIHTMINFYSMMSYSDIDVLDLMADMDLNLEEVVQKLTSQENLDLSPTCVVLSWNVMRQEGFLPAQRHWEERYVPKVQK